MLCLIWCPGLLCGVGGHDPDWLTVRSDGRFSLLAGVRIGEAATPGPGAAEASASQELPAQQPCSAQPRMKLMPDDSWVGARRHILDDPEDDALSQTWSVADMFDHCDGWDEPTTAEQRPSPVVEFLPAAKFGGARPGYIFTKRARGVGYYLDTGSDVDHAGDVDELPVPTLVVPLQLEALLQDEQPHPGSSESPKPSGKGRQGRRRDGPLSCCPGGTLRNDSPDGARQEYLLSWVTGSAPQRVDGPGACSTVHRKLGLWAFDTLNPNAWSGFKDYVSESSADAVLGQEMKLRWPDKVAAAETSLRVAKWSGKINCCTSGPGGGPSAGTAIAVRQHMGMADAISSGWGSLRHRFQVAHVGAVCKGGIYIASIHMHDTCGPTAKINLDLLDEVGACLKALDGPWILGVTSTANPLTSKPPASHSWSQRWYMPLSMPPAATRCTTTSWCQGS